MKKILLILAFTLLSTSCKEEKKSETEIKVDNTQVQTENNKTTNETKTETTTETKMESKDDKMDTSKMASNTNTETKMATQAAKSELQVKIGQTVDLKQGKLIDKKLKNNSFWSTSNKKVVKVDKSGRVTALKEGTVTITAVDKQDKTKRNSVTIQVTAAGVDAKAVTPATSDMVVMETSMGTIKLKLYPKEAPKTVENFTKLAAKGYYDNVTFHRVIDGFMIQGGDPLGTGTGGESIWGKAFEDEFSPNLKFDRKGILAMANAGPNTNGSQFFITLVPTPHLDMRHTIFGEVVEGMDVVEAIGKVAKDPNDKPLTPVVMKKVRPGS
jgi:cyclophilin family peptidyl-prolyl cis-trans isomerase